MTLTEIADKLKEHVDTKGYLDIGTGVEKAMGVSKEDLQTAVCMLEELGYVILFVKVSQSGTEKSLVVKLLASPETTYKDLVIKLK